MSDSSDAPPKPVIRFIVGIVLIGIASVTWHAYRYVDTHTAQVIDVAQGGAKGLIIIATIYAVGYFAVDGIPRLYRRVKNE